MSQSDAQYGELLRQLAADPTAVELRDRLHSRYLELLRGGATPQGLPYPDPTDPVAEGADAIRALAEAVDALLEDTGWIDVTVADGFGTTGTIPQVRRIGKVVFPRGSFSAVGITSTNSNYTVGSVPEGFRPAANAIWAAGTHTAASTANMRVETSGDIIIRTNAALGSYYSMLPAWTVD